MSSSTVVIDVVRSSSTSVPRSALVLDFRLEGCPLSNETILEAREPALSLQLDSTRLEARPSHLGQVSDGPGPRTGPARSRDGAAVGRARRWRGFHAGHARCASCVCSRSSLSQPTVMRMLSGTDMRRFGSLSQGGADVIVASHCRVRSTDCELQQPRPRPASLLCFRWLGGVGDGVHTGRGRC